MLTSGIKRNNLRTRVNSGESTDSVKVGAKGHPFVTPQRLRVDRLLFRNSNAPELAKYMTGTT